METKPVDSPPRRRRQRGSIGSLQVDGVLAGEDRSNLLRAVTRGAPSDVPMAKSGPEHGAESYIAVHL